ncbi:MAG: hypothetical protein WBA15_12485 [Mesorhizobium sp.]
MSAALLTYSDVQKYIKLLRRHGFPCRYFAVGEYGGKKGRSHWHLMLFWKRAVPEHVEERNFMEKHWPHGWSFWKSLKGGEKDTAAAIRYACKYLVKDALDAEKQGHLSMSKKPPIGAEYFRDLARRYVEQGLAPQSLYYHFPSVVGRNGLPKQFMLAEGSATADLFCRAFLDHWAARVGGFAPYSPVIEEYEDRLARDDLEPLKDRWGRKVQPPEGGVETRVGKDPATGYPHTLYSDAQGYRWWYREIEDGEWEWRRGERVARPVQKISMPAGRAAYRKASDGA